ncbi:MAG: anti-anti-sigma factor [Algoriphagus sp.]|nr:anti-anti-sigma factor [Algoriphagus sp.]
MKYTIDKKEQYVVFSPLEEKIDSLLAPKLKSELGDREFGRNGGIFVISGVRDHVMKLLKISMLDKKLRLVANLEEAGEMVFMHEIDGGEDEEGA